jgi:hypothetical protein
MAHALRHEKGQLGLYGGSLVKAPRPSPSTQRRANTQAPLCAGCRTREARYGFRDDQEPSAIRPRTLCFDCFRMEIDWRQSVAARLTRGWNAEPVRLPLEERLNELTRKRRRAQIAARHALEEASGLRPQGPESGAEGGS